jgi:hypothetical protein
MSVGGTSEEDVESRDRVIIIENHIPLADLMCEILQRETPVQVVGRTERFGTFAT